MSLLSLILVWYFTKLYYTHKFTLDLKNGREGVRIVCSKCNRVEYITIEHIRNPYYCNVCK